METIEVYEAEKVGYYVSRFLLKRHIYSAVLHCKNEKIAEAIMLYMTEIGMPWDIDLADKNSLIFSYSENIDADLSFSIVITTNKDIACFSSVNKQGCVFWLKDLNQEEIDSLVIEPEEFDPSTIPMHLRNGDIRRMFLRTFMIAQKEIDIISPWMNFSVVNDALIKLMDKALQRGVSIRIIYGLLPSADEYNQARSNKSDKVAEKLKKTFEKYGNQFSVQRDNIHYKLVLCDDFYKLEGGFNYLSFIGDYSDPSTRKEGSPFGRNVEEIQLLRKGYFES